MPPYFWAKAVPPTDIAISAALATAAARNLSIISLPPRLSIALPALPDYLSSQTSSMRAPLKTLLTMIVSPFTYGCQQVARRS